MLDVILFGWCAPTAAACARAVCASGARLGRVVTGPDRAESALTSAAIEAGAALDLVGDPNAPELAAMVQADGADVILVAGWPARLGPALRQAARFGAVNVHPSLLPRYRARDPVFWTVLSGDERTGVTLHAMTEDIDAGPILLQRDLAVPPRSTSVSLSARLDALAAELTLELFAAAQEGSWPEARPQPGAPTKFPPVAAAHGELQWTEPAEVLDRRVRACAGVIEARADYRGMKIVVLEAEPAARVSSTAHAPGTFVEARDDDLIVATGDERALALRRCAFLGRIRSGAELAGELGASPGDRFDVG